MVQHLKQPREKIIAETTLKHSVLMWSLFRVFSLIYFFLVAFSSIDFPACVSSPISFLRIPLLVILCFHGFRGLRYTSISTTSVVASSDEVVLNEEQIFNASYKYMGRYGRKEGKNRGKVQINFEITFVCYVEMIICWVFVVIILREMLLIERGALSVHSSLFNYQSPMFISNLRYRLPSSYACARILQGFCIFCCHKCHTVLFLTSVFDLQVSRCFSENHTSF